MTYIRRTCTVLRLIGLALLIAGASPVRAQSGDDLDVTMRMVMDDEELSGELVREIELPAPASMAPVTPSGNARSEAAETREEVLEEGRSFGQSMADEARNRREDKGIDGPGRRPEKPGKPDGTPGKPDRPPGKPDKPPGKPDKPLGKPGKPPGKPGQP